MVLKTLKMIQDALKDSDRLRHKNKLLALRGIQVDLAALEYSLASDPRSLLEDIRAMRTLIGELETKLARAESAAKRYHW